MTPKKERLLESYKEAKNGKQEDKKQAVSAKDIYNLKNEHCNDRQTITDPTYSVV